jgi:hypothetical protein
MNIFILHKNPKIAAGMQCDKHVVKMILESAQMLCSPFVNGEAPYKRAYYNHPCSVWARKSAQNYNWLINHGHAISNEYTNRYQKIHKSSKVIEWCELNWHQLNLPNIGLTPFAQAMPEQYKAPCAVTAYRSYYKGEKAYFAKWTNKKAPAWFA